MSSLLRLKPYLKPQMGLLLGSLALAIPLSAIRTAPAPMVQKLVDNLKPGNDASLLWQFSALFIGLYLVNFVIRFLHYYFMRIVVVRTNQALKNDLFGHLMGLSADYFTSQSTGSLISRVANDTQMVDNGLASLNVLIREPITFLFLFGYALHLNWRLTLFLLLIFPPLAWVFRITGRNLKRYISKITEESARIYSTLQESFTGVRIIQSYRLENYVQKRFLGQTGEFTRILLKTSALEEASHPMVELITAFAIALVIHYGGSQVLAGQMTSGELFAFFLAFGLMMHPIRLLNDVSMKLHTASAACERIFQVFDWKTRLTESPNPKPIQDLHDRIRLMDVRFAYPDAAEREVLRGVSFDIPKGQAVALVGASGAGKSSLVSLLPRVFDVTAGSITLDGQDIRELKLSDLRGMMAVVSQDIFLFNDTVAENIRCGNLDASFDEIREAARRVGRDVKAVHADLTALLNAGVLERNEQGGVVFPYDAVKVEFLLEAA
jgi:subfamily B ATP-binding cassette protein MsbA